MAFLVRKLAKRDNLSILSDINDVGELNVDIPTAEFRAKDGTLSTWKIDSLKIASGEAGNTCLYRSGVSNFERCYKLWSGS